MKSVIGMIITYLAICIAGTAAGAVLFMLYEGCRTFIAGVPLAVFSIKVFEQGLVFMFPVSLFCSSLFLGLYKIRHPDGFLFPFIAYVFLVALTWSCVFPTFFYFVGPVGPNDIVTHKKDLSADYFRKDGSYIYYFTGDNTGIGITPGNAEDVSGSVFSLESRPDLQNNNSSFSEPLVGDTLKLPHLMAYVLSVFTALSNTARNAYNGGLWAWIFFSSLGLAMLSIYGFVRCSSWRLLNNFLVIFFTAALYFVNYLYYSKGIFASVEKAFNGWIIKFIPLHVPFIVIINDFCILIFCCVGIISLFSRSNGRGSE